MQPSEVRTGSVIEGRCHVRDVEVEVAQAMKRYLLYGAYSVDFGVRVRPIDDSFFNAHEKRVDYVDYEVVAVEAKD